MTAYTWKITEITAEEGVILHAKYHVTAYDETNSVETEGNWWFSDKIVKKPFDQVTEEDVAQWIEQESIQDGNSTIKSGLDKQLANLGKKAVIPPWMPQIFKPEI